MSGTTWGLSLCLAAGLMLAGVLLSLLSHYVRSRSGDQNPGGRFEQLLPGINCGQCGYPGCQAYAAALAAGGAAADRCRPAGPEVARQLAALLGQSLESGRDFDEELFLPREVAYIHESECIGCCHCLRACRVDSIAGTKGQPHRVDPEECVSCGECLKVCPVDCIEMIRLEYDLSHYNWKIAATAAGARA